MRIVIAGAGEVGSHLAKMLSVESHSITVVDQSDKRLASVTAVADVITVEGDLTSVEVLQKAEVDKCDLFVAVSPEENANLIATMLAKQLGGRRVVARINNDEYLSPGIKELFVNMGIDHMLYPEKEASEVILKLLAHTSTSEYVEFAGGKLILLALRVDEGSPLSNEKLGHFRIKEGGSLSYRTVALVRGSMSTIPKRTDIIRAGDVIYVITKPEAISEVMSYTGKTHFEIKNMMILGGSKIARRVARKLQSEINIKLLDYNPEKAYKMAESLDKTLIINDDGRRIEVMEEEGLPAMDVFLALTGRSETNILSAMQARKMGVKKIIAEVENLDFINFAESVGIDSIINKKLITASAIFGFTSESDVQTVKCLNGCDAEVLEFIAKTDSLATRSRVADIGLPSGAVIGGIVRGQEVFIAGADTQIKPYDRVVVFSLPNSLSKIGKFFE
ncbi:MAG: Trk system potassium transporter TrkA [Rikenellaceae bacterium]